MPISRICVTITFCNLRMQLCGRDAHVWAVNFFTFWGGNFAVLILAAIGVMHSGSVSVFLVEQR